jgi:hypothetical protein
VKGGAIPSGRRHPSKKLRRRRPRDGFVLHALLYAPAIDLDERHSASDRRKN